MSIGEGTVTVGECKAAVAFAVEMPVDQVSGYVVVAVDPDNQINFVANMCCGVHTAAVLAEAINRILGNTSCPAGTPEPSQ